MLPDLGRLRGSHELSQVLDGPILLEHDGASDVRDVDQRVHRLVHGRQIMVPGQQPDENWDQPRVDDRLGDSRVGLLAADHVAQALRRVPQGNVGD